MNMEPNRNIRKDGEHIVKMWTPLNFKITKDYKFFIKNKVFCWISAVLKIVVIAILDIFNRIFFGLKVEGRKNVKNIKGGCITICNHVHILDCTMIAIALRKINLYFLSLKSNFEIPIINFVIRILGAVPIPNNFQSMKALNYEIGQALNEKKFIHVYPEGVLYPYYEGEVRNFKKGAFKFAYDGDVPILPIVIRFNENKGVRRLIFRKPQITIKILEPIYPDVSEKRTVEVNNLMKQCETVMNENLISGFEKRFQKK